MSFENKLLRLFEGSFNGHTEMSEEDIRKKVQSEASQFKPQQKIYHHIPNGVLPSPEIKFLSYDPASAGDEKKQMYYELIMDNLKKWEAYPNTKNGVVAYSDKAFATETGIPFIVVPVDGASVGICSRLKLIDSFSYVSINLGIKFDVFDRSLNILLNIFNNPEGTYDVDTKKITLSAEKNYNNSYKEFFSAAKAVDANFASSSGLLDQIAAHPYNKETEDNVISIIEYLRAKNITLTGMFGKLFDPIENGFKVIPFEQMIVGEHKQKEVWLNTKCFLIKETEFLKIVGD